MAYNILIIDDSSIVRKVLIKAFGMTEIPVNAFLQAENGKVGLELLRQNPVDFIFLDINMPVMNGMQFMTEMLADPKYKNTPVIVVSTEGSQERQQELKDCGVKAYLRKPVSPENLVSTINTVLKGE